VFVRLDMDSFQVGNDKNNKKYNKRFGFIPGQKLIVIKYAYDSYIKDWESIHESRGVESNPVACTNYETILLQLIFNPK